MNAARLAAEMSTCAGGRRVGAVAVVGGQVVATGVNGVPTRYPHPDQCIRRDLGIPSGQQPHLCGCVHAEANAIANAAKHGTRLEGAALFLTCQPCRACMGLLANAGIVSVYYDGDYPDPEAVTIAQWAGIELIRHSDGID